MTQPANSAALWDDLKQLVRDVVEEMNRLEEFRNKTGGLDYQLTATDSIVVATQTLPGFKVNITRRPEVLQIDRILGSGAESVEAQEGLAIEFDASSPSFRNEAGELLTIDETVYYVLRPFLHLNRVVGLRAVQPE
jgi:hypothetical protein